MTTATELRQMKGEMIASMENQIERLFDFEYLVNSQSKEGKQFRVLKTVEGWSYTQISLNPMRPPLSNGRIRIFTSKENRCSLDLSRPSGSTSWRTSSDRLFTAACTQT